jgi:hypothetical protein
MTHTGTIIIGRTWLRQARGGGRWPIPALPPARAARGRRLLVVLGAMQANVLTPGTERWRLKAKAASLDEPKARLRDNIVDRLSMAETPWARSPGSRPRSRSPRGQLTAVRL